MLQPGRFGLDAGERSAILADAAAGTRSRHAGEASTASDDRTAKDIRQIVPARFMRERVLLESAALAHWNGFPCQKRFIAFEPLGPQHQRVRRDPATLVKNEANASDRKSTGLNSRH